MVAKPTAVKTFEQIEERPAVVALHQRRFEKLDDLMRRAFQGREWAVGANGGSQFVAFKVAIIAPR